MIKPGLLFVIIVLLVTAGCGESKIMFKGAKGRLAKEQEKTRVSERWEFDENQPGATPLGVASYLGNWKVRPVAAAPSGPNALCQVGTFPRSEFPSALMGTTVYQDFDATVFFKPVSGVIDQAGGIIFKVKDKKNYLIVRANALENNVSVYKYLKGKRSLIAENPVKVAADIWHELKISVRGKEIKGFLDDRLIVEAKDNAFLKGSVGLWTKADSITCFDNFEVHVPIKNGK